MATHKSPDVKMTPSSERKERKRREEKEEFEEASDKMPF
jgi:hypothetical protein